ncbi:hypothetical protein B0H13DRAFT_1664891, partial [Mycena leptocephala]
YVAKRCYTIGSGSPVSIIDTRDQLIKEGTTLGRAKFFLNSFKKERESEDIEISGVSNVLPDTEKDELKTNSAIISSVTWLLEQERGNVQLRKYSGTLDHPRYSDKQGTTINAFQHFSYCYSNNTLVLADIQGKHAFIFCCT